MKGIVGSSNTRPALATALSKFMDIFSEGLKEWKDQLIFANTAPELCQRENLRLLLCIEGLESGLAIQSHNNNGDAIMNTNHLVAGIALRDHNTINDDVMNNNHHESGLALRYL
jgi:hypothetical protein